MNLKFFCLNLLLIIILRISKLNAQGSNSLVPLNINDLINKINNHRFFKFDDKNVKNVLFTAANIRKENLVTQNILHFNISKECSSQIKYFLNSLENKEYWALQIIDSFGKVPSGILNGDLTWLGEFNVCRNKSFSEYYNFTGNYVLFAKPINPMDIFRAEVGVTIKYAFCAPIECSKEDIVTIFNSIIDKLPINNTGMFKINSSFIQFQPDKTLDSAAIVSLSFIGVIILIVLIGTTYDVYKRYVNYIHCQEIVTHSTALINNSNDESNLQTEAIIDNTDEIDYEHLYFINLSHEPAFFRMLVNFSAFTNTKKIFKIDFTNQQLGCLHGIRVLSLCWVILGHSYVFGLTFSDNIMVIVSWLQRFSFMIISNAFFSVDSFFLLSGLLTCFVFLRHYEKMNLKISFRLMLKYYVHRIWRLSPPYFICLLISANLSPYFGIGPLYPPEGFEYDKCRNSWYWNVLYVNNLVDSKQMCFGVSWYLANDMQFHWIAPLVLIPLALKKTIIAFVFIILLLVANLVSIPITLIQYPGMESAQFGPLFADFFNKFYILPWCRISPFILGIAAGYLIIMHKKTSFKLSQKLNLALWFCSLTIFGLLIFGLYPDARGINPLNKIDHIVYQTLSRLAWSVSLAFVIYACITNNGGFVNKILSSHIWVPFSRLSYSAFLVHTMVIIYFYTTQEHLFHIQDTTMIYFYVSNLLLSYFFGYIVSILFEIPLINLEKFVF